MVSWCTFQPPHVKERAHPPCFFRFVFIFFLNNVRCNPGFPSHRPPGLTSEWMSALLLRLRSWQLLVDLTKSLYLETVCAHQTKGSLGVRVSVVADTWPVDASGRIIYGFIPEFRNVTRVASAMQIGFYHDSGACTCCELEFQSFSYGYCAFSFSDEMFPSNQLFYCLIDNRLYS